MRAIYRTKVAGRLSIMSRADHASGFRVYGFRKYGRLYWTPGEELSGAVEWLPSSRAALDFMAANPDRFTPDPRILTGEA